MRTSCPGSIVKSVLIPASSVSVTMYEPAAPDTADWHAALVEAMSEQPLRAAVDEIAARFSLKRKEVYDAALALKNAQ